MREAIMELAAKNGLPLSVTGMTLDALLSMDELFITNSLIGMKRVTKLGDTIFKDVAVTDLIFKELLVTEEDYAQAV
jgi:branched-subunit amino acid aminotransferase/4-amino-4-deoxychorismate lyase